MTITEECDLLEKERTKMRDELRNTRVAVESSKHNALNDLNNLELAKTEVQSTEKALKALTLEKEVSFLFLIYINSIISFIHRS